MNKEKFQHYKTGIDFIDEGHWELIDLMNQINLIENKEKILELLNQLCIKFHEHCKKEEEMLLEINYQYFKIHFTEHAKLYLELSKLKEDVKQKKISQSGIMTSLQKCLVDHIDWQDMQYVKSYKDWKNR